MNELETSKILKKENKKLRKEKKFGQFSNMANRIKIYDRIYF